MLSKVAAAIGRGIRSLIGRISFGQSEEQEEVAVDDEELRERLARLARGSGRSLATASPVASISADLAASRFVSNYGPMGPDGVIRHLKDGKLHRDDGPAVIEPHGTLRWYRDGLEHREDGPAILHPNGSAYWMQNGKPHRLDGPAIVHSNGSKDYYIEGTRLSEVQFERAREAHARGEPETTIGGQPAVTRNNVAQRQRLDSTPAAPAPRPPGPANNRKS